MLDIGFWELILIGIVALVVLGPDKLPGAVRSVASIMRNVRQTANNLKAELNHELRVNELHQQLKEAEQKGMTNLNEGERSAIAELEAAAREVNSIHKDITQPTSEQSAQTKPKNEQP
ncbi:sec-independent translocase [Catenovulum agarivorans DS-2]|uniref:Sec-independent protein translocase protein TatB n=1 Tax=Catenovulum agarivorans DS-2 TaxID=1328313 RepID=W7QQB8_9ALTE|nr:Sec-independent protein translocase protein TatB [Catenovulum agarivorans]EWH11167.1 sec-independent translocase [Catenovulum agarivorans DS-2]